MQRYIVLAGLDCHGPHFRVERRFACTAQVEAWAWRLNGFWTRVERGNGRRKDQ